ncbi:MAG: XRE family transcriptional regulator [Oscillospiraceae bacterium]|nr:XRE family transcriptional regulator [Oscillospiraceae bacterium]MCL2227833.1 XRE family transcriptional regulator [Oscillospiraceae bacterium]
MSYGTILAQLRKSGGHTQAEVAEHISRASGKACSFKVVSHWENGVSSPSVEQFLLLCEYYGVRDIQHTFRNASAEFRGFAKLNALGKNRAEEYITMLSANPMFSESESSSHVEPASKPRRLIKLYDIPAAAGTGVFLDSDCFSEIEADETVPGEADFAVRVSGDSMEPSFVDGQVVFIREQRTIEVGEIGIFALNGDSYVKKLGDGELISINPHYKPIMIHEYDSFYIFGKVLG